MELSILHRDVPVHRDGHRVYFMLGGPCDGELSACKVRPGEHWLRRVPGYAGGMIGATDCDYLFTWNGVGALVLVYVGSHDVKEL